MDLANRRQLVKTGTLSAGVLLLAALLLIVNYFGWKYYKRFDWTSSHLYSLSEKSVNVLKGLKRDVDFFVFLSPDQQHELYQPTTEVLARYGAVSRHVHVRVVDAAKNPIEAQQLRGRDNFELSEWSSLGQTTVPAGTDLLVVAGPTGSFVKPELDAFSSYLNGGGRMLVMLDPTLGQAGAAGLVQTGLEAWLASLGLKAGQDIVVDPSNPLPFFGPETIFSRNFGEHPITKALAEANQPVLVTLARSMAKGSAPGLKVTELMRTSTEGWGETNLANLEKVSRDPQDVPGPVPLAAAAESDPPPVGRKGLRLVAFGDSDFATNQLLQANVANAVLLSNAFNWLVEREALLGIPPKKTEQVRLTLTGDEFRRVWLLAAALPLLAVILGAAVFSRRRR